MYKNKKIIAIIPARGGSKGIPQKNIKNLAGKPLIAWTIEQAKKSKYIDEVYVSTDSKGIEAISKDYGSEVISRPASISGDTASTESALLHASTYLKEDYDIMILFQCTSPLRYSKQIDGAIEKIFIEKSDSLLTGYENDRFYWDNKGNSLNYDFKKRPRRQDKDWEFVENGSFYIFKKESLLKNKNRLGGKVSQYIMPKWMSFEIDEPFDFELIEILMKKKFLKEASFEKKLEKVKMILFDVDGVFTDGSVYLDKKGNESLKFSRIDGKGIELLRKKGFLLGVISSEKNKIVEKRMEKLQIKEVALGIKDKLAVYEYLKIKYKLEDSEICFCGDDIQDLPVIKICGVGCCPKNAQQAVIEICDFKSDKIGGSGFVRDVANLFLE
ncbi:MAG: acylneuraminate cytidylyltransferase [Bacteroidales bacterium]|jgi:YrbI family 3-deoxy-D-manno-octulosonate 8-phosphate phosphatase|nr:acylneuraminate cytidylyltransferase [Bacteroidales bacterium]